MTTTNSPAAQPQEGELLPIYVASRASLLERGQMWRRFRTAGSQITSSWIDEDANEIRDSAALVLYAEVADFPLKGALIEAGIALGMGKPVIVCLPDSGVLPRSYRPIGSWIAHPLVTRCDDVNAAVKLAASTRADLPRATAAAPDERDRTLARQVIDSVATYYGQVSDDMTITEALAELREMFGRHVEIEVIDCKAPGCVAYRYQVKVPAS